MSELQAQAVVDKSGRRRFQFGLKTLLLGVAVVAVVLGLYRCYRYWTADVPTTKFFGDFLLPFAAESAARRAGVEFSMPTSWTGGGIERGEPRRVATRSAQCPFDVPPEKQAAVMAELEKCVEEQLKFDGLRVMGRHAWGTGFRLEYESWATVYGTVHCFVAPGQEGGHRLIVYIDEWKR